MKTILGLRSMAEKSLPSLWGKDGGSSSVFKNILPEREKLKRF
jgi:hypothetical protein